MNKISATIALPCLMACSIAMAEANKSTLLQAAESQPTASESRTTEDKQLVIDITRGLLQISERVLQNLSRFLPASEAATIAGVRLNFAQLMAKLDTQPDAVLSAAQDDQLEPLLTKFGPGDPFSSAPILTVDALKPGDIILRCSSALSSQMTELMIWSRYTHSALYIGNGMIIDATWQHGVKTRSLDDFLREANGRVGVLRFPGLTADQARAVVSAAQAKESAQYNFEGVRVLGAQKLDALADISRQSLGDMIDILGRAEQLPPTATGNGKYACSELIAFAFKAINISLSHASGFTPGDMIRLSQAGFFAQVGRLRDPAQ